MLRLLFFLLLVTVSSAASAPPPSILPSDVAALLAFRSAADPTSTRLHFAINRSSLSSTHCSWPGVQCSPQLKVIRLVLESYALNGTLAANSLNLLDQLRILSLKNNSLSGPIPDLSGLLNLKALFLDHNSFSGSFPLSLLSLHRLRTLDLSHNLLSGPIPPKIASLDRLYCVRLESNLFNGSVPPMNQSGLRIFNVSQNELSGAVPVTTALSNFSASSFSDNPGLCGEVVRRECRSRLNFFHSSLAPGPAKSGGGSRVDDHGFSLPSNEKSSSSSSLMGGKFRRRAVVPIGFLAGAFILIGLIALFIAVRSNRRRKMRQGKLLTPDKSEEMLRGEETSNAVNPIDQIENSNNELVAATQMSEEKVKKLGRSGCLVFCAGEAQIYTLEQLMRASAELLGRGSVGSTYKAVLDNRLNVSVKRLDAMKMGETGKEGFERHLEEVGRLRHPNLVPLRAYFQAKEERLIVYDYQSNGSLYSLIHGLFTSLIIKF